MAQSLTQHEWENRVVLLFVADFQDEELKQQLSFFQKDKKGLEDRKLVVYQISPTAVKKDGVFLKNNSNIKNWFKEFGIENQEFTFILIGLDGGEKMRNSRPISVKNLFSKIDRMPMRRAEIRRNKN